MNLLILYSYNHFKNNAAIKIVMQGFEWTHLVISLRVIHRNAMARTYGKCMLSILNLLKKCCTIFQSHCSILHFQW